jgi:signal transduction histidine kinase
VPQATLHEDKGGLPHRLKNTLLRYSRWLPWRNGKKLLQNEVGMQFPAPRSLSLFLKQKIIRMTRRYGSQLRVHLGNGSHLNSRSAERLGQEAIREGLGTLDLANIHGLSMLKLVPANSRPAARAKKEKIGSEFFLEVLMPIEKTRGAAVGNLAELKRSNKLLQMRSTELMITNRRLKTEVIHRKSAESSLRLSEQNHRVLLKESRSLELRLRHLSRQVLSAQEEERKEISRELHDEVVQTLTGINVQLASLKIESGVSKQSFTKHISYTQRLVEKSVNIVHQFARDLRPTLLDDLGLIPALHAYMKGFTKRTGIQVRFTAFAGVERLSNDKQTVLYRVAQASLINVAEHARASIVSVTIKEIADGTSMHIKDDGRSFDVDHVLDSRRNKRLGLIGMRERVEMVGGRFQVESSPGQGTTISATLPLRNGKID